MLTQLGRNNQLFMLGNFLYAFGMGLWINLRPLYLADLGTSPEQIGFVLAIGGISAGIFPFPSGILSDRIGPRRVILLAWTAALAGAIVIAAAQTWQMVAVGIFLFSLTWAANPAVTSFVVLSMPKELRGTHLEKAFSWVFRVFPIAMIFAPGLGGVIADRAGIRMDVIISIGAFILAILIFWQSEEVKAGLSPQVNTIAPLMINRNYWVVAIFFGLLMLAHQVGYVLMPNFLEDSRGFSKSMIGGLFSIGFLGTFVANILLVHVRPRTGFLALMIAPWLAMVLLWQLTSPLWAWLAFFLLGGITAMWIIKAACTGRVVSEEMQGIAFGLVESMGFVAVSIASGIAGLLYAATESHTLPLITSIVSIPLVFLWWYFYVVRKTGQPPK